MRSFPFLLFIFLFVGCGKEPSPSPSTLPPSRFYPEGISRVVGIASTREIFDESSTSETVLRELKDAGFHWVRLDIVWSEVETEPGVFSFPFYEKAFRVLQRHSLKPLVILDYGNPLYTYPPRKTIEGSTDKVPPRDLRPFLRYVTTVVEKFRQTCTTYEIWNEPNAWFRFWLSERGPEGDRYALLVKEVTETIKGVCPECTVLTGGLVYLDYPLIPGQKKFMEEMKKAVPAIFSLVDGIGFHYYTFYPPANPPEWSGGGEVPLEEALKETHSTCACTTPIYITETGWTISGGVSPTEQARYATRALAIALMYGVKTFLWFTGKDLDPQGVVVPQEAFFGLFTEKGEPKPVFSAIKRFLLYLGESREVRDLREVYRLKNTGNFLLSFHLPDGKEYLLLWTYGQKNPLPPTLQGKTGISLTDGGEVTLTHFTPDPVLLPVEK
jgi:hypothetical protein